MEGKEEREVEGERKGRNIHHTKKSLYKNVISKSFPTSKTKNIIYHNWNLIHVIPCSRRYKDATWSWLQWDLSKGIPYKI